MFLRRFFFMHRLKLVAAAVFAAMNAVITVGVFGELHGVAMHGRGESVGQLILWNVLLLLALLVVNMCSQYISSRLGSQLIANIRSDISLGLIGLSCEKFLSKGHVVFETFMEDVSRIAPLVAMIPAIMYNATIVAACSIYLLTISPELFGVLSAGIAIPAAVYWALDKTVRAKFDTYRGLDAELFGHLRAISDGKKQLALDRGRSGHFWRALLSPAIKKSEAAMADVNLYLGLFQAWSSFIVYIALFAILYFGKFILNLPLSVVATFIVGGIYLTGPFIFLTQMAQQIASGWASLRHLERLGLDLTADVASVHVPAPSRSGGGNNWSLIRANGLFYRFPSAGEGRGEVGPVGLDIRRGEIIFLVGGNGAGKSTFLLMLCGLLSPGSGSISIDGVDVKENIDAYRDLFCGVFSDFFLFRHVLDKNSQCLSDEDLLVLLREMDLDGIAGHSSGVLSSVDFSTGQRKRLALLQCLASDRDIFFFDEWAAEQDPLYREYFYMKVLRDLKLKGKTVIVISHDDRYFHIADHIVTIGQGRVVSDISVQKELSGLTSEIVAT